MNRRGFIQRIGAAVVGLTLSRTLPAIGGYPFVAKRPLVLTSNTLITPEWVSQEVAKMWVDMIPPFSKRFAS